MVGRNSGVDHGLVYLAFLDLSKCVLSAEIEPQDSVSQGDWFRWVSGYGCVDRICKTLPIHVLCVPSSAPVDDGGAGHLAAYGYRDGQVVRS